MKMVLNDIAFFILGFAVGYVFYWWWTAPDMHKLRKRIAELEHAQRKNYDIFIKTKKKDGIEIDPDA